MITIVLPISRKDYLKEVFSSLTALKRPKDTELLIVVDGDLENDIEPYLIDLNMSSIRIIKYGYSPAGTVNERRFRISNIHNFAKYYVSEKSDYVFLIEDDTLYPSNTLHQFLKHMDGQTAFIEGVELSRHNVPYVGAWIADNVQDPTIITSVLRTSKYEQVDAGGLYCCLVDADIYRTHHFEPFDKEGANGLSCDVNLGLSIRKRGYNCYIDWSVQCDHLSESGPINISNTDPRQVIFEKAAGKWKARTIE